MLNFLKFLFEQTKKNIKHIPKICLLKWEKNLTDYLMTLNINL